jgi:AraC-like DNA-binding protein
METQFDHAVELAPAATSSGRSRVIFSEISKSDYIVGSSPFSLNFVLEGEECYEVGGETFRVRPGQFLLLEAGTHFRVTFPKRTITRALCLCLPGSFRRYGGATEQGGIVLSGTTTGLGRRLRASAAAVAADPRIGPTIADALASGAMEELPRFAAFMNQRLDALPAQPATARALLQRLDRACDYLHTHVEAPVSLDRLARVAGMSPYHLARSFKAAYGDAPTRFHQRLRMERAADELQSGRLSAGKAAERYGFSDQSSFSRAFRRHFRTSPAQHAAGGRLLD